MVEKKFTSNPLGNPKYTWDDTVGAIGKDFSGGNEILADEVIEYTSVVRLCEPWEIGNPIYWSEQVAKQLGYRGVVAPLSALRSTFLKASGWKPGQKTQFPTPEPNASFPLHPTGEEIPMPPVTNGAFTNMEMEFFEPVCVGDRLTVRGDKLVNASLKRTRVGFGAFVTRERRAYNQRGELVARITGTTYCYNRE